MNKYLAFDIEIANKIPEGEIDWKDHRPLGITCAAATSSNGDLWNWYAHDGRGKFTPRMTREQCRQMLNDLGRLVDLDYTILTWNGLFFDLDILAEESGEHTICKRLALEHVDTMFQIFCIKGFPLGLDAALAPVLWAEGQYHKVLDYVSWDVKNTLALAHAVEEKGQLDWISRSGRPNSCPIPVWLTVRQSLEMIPEPDTSWMTNPWPRSKFYDWLGPKEGEDFTTIWQMDKEGPLWHK